MARVHLLNISICHGGLVLAPRRGVVTYNLQKVATSILNHIVFHVYCAKKSGLKTLYETLVNTWVFLCHPAEISKAEILENYK